MSAPGEIRTLSASPSPTCACGPTSARRTSSTSRRSTRSPTPRPRSSRAPTPTRVLVANGDDARVMARAARFAGRTVTFGLDRPADVSATRHRIARHPTAWPPTSPPPRARCGSRRRWSGAATSPTSWPAWPSASTPACRSTRSRRRRRRWRRPAHRGEVRALPPASPSIDDAYNANPLAVERALDVLGADAGGGASPCSARCSSSARTRPRCTHACGRAAARAGVDLLVTVGGAPARASADGARRGGHRRRRRPPRCDAATRRPSIVAGLVRPGDVVLVKGSRGVAHSSASSIALAWRGALMLYHLLYSLHRRRGSAR